MTLSSSRLNSGAFNLEYLSHHGQISRCNSVAVHKERGLVAVGSADGLVKVVGASGLELLFDVNNGVIFLSFTAQGDIVTVSSDSCVKLWTLETRHAASLKATLPDK